jgi:hypothetical protein
MGWLLTTVEEYNRLGPLAYSSIVRLEFSEPPKLSSDNSDVEAVVLIVLAKGPDLDGERLVLRFRGVTGLRFQQPWWSPAAFGLIEIHEGDGALFATEDEGGLSFHFSSFLALREGPN